MSDHRHLRELAFSWFSAPRLATALRGLSFVVFVFSFRTDFSGRDLTIVPYGFGIGPVRYVPGAGPRLRARSRHSSAIRKIAFSA